MNTVSELQLPPLYNYIFPEVSDPRYQILYLSDKLTIPLSHKIQRVKTNTNTSVRVEGKSIKESSYPLSVIARNETSTN